MNDQQLRQLGQAAQAGNRGRVEQLLGAVSNLNKLADEKGPLHLAAENGHVAIVEMLLDRRADPNFRDANGCTALMSAIERGQTGAIRCLLRAGTDKEAADKNGARALHWAVQMGLTEVTNELIAAGCEKDAKAKFDSSPMHIGARSGYADTVMALVRAGANVEALTNQSYTPLHIAAMKGNTDVARVLVDNNADLEARSNRKMTPLHMASTQGHKETVQVLLAAGANPSAQDQDGNKPSDVALAKGFAELKGLLVKAEQEFALSGSAAKPGTRFQQVLALHPYLPEIFRNEHRESDLSFRPGDIIRNVVVTSNAWWEGEIQGKRGSFPSNFVACTVQDTVTVKHNYYPTRADEMSIKEGDSVQVYEKRKSGWWRGICNGRGGLFPANHVHQGGDERKKKKGPGGGGGGLKRQLSQSTSSAMGKSPAALPSSPFGSPKPGSLPKFGSFSGIPTGGSGGGPPALKTPPPIAATPPPIKAQPPLIKTQPPPIKTQPPPIKTQPPPIKTQPPPIKTQPPPIKTQPPPIKTMPPSMPNTGPKKQNKPGPPKGMHKQGGMPKKPSPPGGMSMAGSPKTPSALPSMSGPPKAQPSALPTFTPVSTPPAAVPPPIAATPPPAQTFITPTVATPPPPRAKADSLFDDEDEMGMMGVEEPAPAPVSTPEDAPAFDVPNSAQRAKVIYAYEPQHPGDLALVVGTTIEILKTEGGWWEGKHLGQTGIFPANYVQML